MTSLREVKPRFGEWNRGRRENQTGWTPYWVKLKPYISARVFGPICKIHTYAIMRLHVAFYSGEPGTEESYESAEYGLHNSIFCDLLRSLRKRDSSWSPIEVIARSSLSNIPLGSAFPVASQLALTTCLNLAMKWSIIGGLKYPSVRRSPSTLIYIIIFKSNESLLLEKIYKWNK